MKNNLTLITLLFFTFSAKSQTPITAIDTSSAPAGNSVNYSVPNNSISYIWGRSPYDSVLSLNGFTSGDTTFTHAGFIPGTVVLRRVDNVKVQGNFSLEWVEAVTTNGTVNLDSLYYNMFTPYQNNLDSFLNNHTFNKGTDNLFDNTATNSNNIERLDWITTSSYLSPTPARVGFAIFDKAMAGTPHDPFVIAAITSIDGSGNPLTYGNILRVVPSDYGNSGITVTYRIVKGIYGSNLLDAGTATQSLGGVFISLQDLGVAANTPIYGYSLFSNDLPTAATSANLVDYTNPTYFPKTTPGASGGLDLVAVTGLFISNSILPIGFMSFNAVENNNIINLNWAVENEGSVQRYEVERSEDGINYIKINEVKTLANANSGRYSIADNVASVTSSQLYYRIKQYTTDGSYHYSKIIPVKRDKIASAIILYPNPVKSNLNLIINSNSNDNAVISVFNSTGLKVINQQEQLANGNNSIIINGISKLPKGVYQLSIKRLNNGNVITKQFSKQ